MLLFLIFKMSEETIDIQERRIMIIPVGLEKQRITEGCKPYAANIVYLINNPGNLKNNNIEKALPSVYKYSLRFSEIISEEFEKSYVSIKSESTNLNSFFDCISKLNEIYEKEIKTKRLKHIYINVSTSSKAFALAAYVFALFHYNLTTIFYLKTSEYILLNYLEKEVPIKKLQEEFLNFGLTKGPYVIDEIPLFPIISFNSFEQDLIKILSARDEFDTINDLIEIIFKNFELENEKKLNKDIKSEKYRLRMQIRRSLESFKEKGLIELQREGRNLKIKINPTLKNLIKLFY